jgi:predicted signal transduction protein with EAL and GGDEF domain
VQQDWPVALLDLLVVIALLIVFIYVYKSNNVKPAGLVLILVALSGNVVSFYMKGIGQVYWVYPAMLAAYYVMSPKTGILVNFIMMTFYMPKLIQSLDFVHISTILITIGITNIIAFVFASGLRKQEKLLKKLASEDYLTSTGNRRALDKELDTLHKKLKNHDKTATMALLDLDHFKRVNDKYGHIKGDEVLVHLSELLKSFYQKQEKIVRYGGE